MQVRYVVMGLVAGASVLIVLVAHRPDRVPAPSPRIVVVNASPSPLTVGALALVEPARPEASGPIDWSWLETTRVVDTTTLADGSTGATLEFGQGTQRPVTVGTYPVPNVRVSRIEPSGVTFERQGETRRIAWVAVDPAVQAKARAAIVPGIDYDATSDPGTPAMARWTNAQTP